MATKKTGRPRGRPKQSPLNQDAGSSRKRIAAVRAHLDALGRLAPAGGTAQGDGTADDLPQELQAYRNQRFREALPEEYGAPGKETAARKAFNRAKKDLSGLSTLLVLKTDEPAVQLHEMTRPLFKTFHRTQDAVAFGQGVEAVLRTLIENNHRDNPEFKLEGEHGRMWLRAFHALAPDDDSRLSTQWQAAGRRVLRDPANCDESLFTLWATGRL